MIKSEILAQLYSIQQDLENLEELESETWNYYFKQLNTHIDINSTNFDKKIDNFTLVLNKKTSQKIITEIISLKKQEYAELFESLGGI